MTPGGCMFFATVLAKNGPGYARPPAPHEDEARAATLLAAAFGRPPEPKALEKMRRAAELWNAGEKAPAHIHLRLRTAPATAPRPITMEYLALPCVGLGLRAMVQRIKLPFHVVKNNAPQG
jgi:hypothetical protein